MRAPWYWDKVDLFTGADKRARGDFLAHAESISLKSGRHIFRAGDRATHAYFLQSGMAKVYDLSPSGLITLFWFCLPGDILGPGAISGADEQAVYAQVVSNATVLAIKRDELERVLRANPDLAMNVIRMVSSRLRLVSEMMTDTQCLRAEERLARLLLRLAKNWGILAPGGVQLPLRISHQELANMIGSCRQTVNSTLRKFQRQGLLLIDRRSITLSDSDELQRLAGLDTLPSLPQTKREQRN